MCEGLICLLTAGFLAQAAPLDRAAAGHEIAAQFQELSLPVPTVRRVIVCHGFACKYRTLIHFGAGDHAALQRLMAPPAASPERERAAVAKAVAWFGRRIAPEAGTAGAKARAGPLSSGDPSQFDCVEAALNTTSLLLMLEDLRLLRHHRVEPTASRWRPLDLEVHTTAVLSEARSGRKWAFDAWVRNSGEVPDVRPLDDWYRGN
ncbi:MAG TPA: hypothetical protein VIH40_08185 [Xanthobacteraceae bacterium]